MSEKAKILQKLVFDVQVTTKGSEDVSKVNRSFVFIYGVAPEGVSDFEIAVSDLKIGDSIKISMSEINLRTYLDRLFLIFCKQTNLVEFNKTMGLILTLRDISTPAATEIISAMAEVQKMGSCSGSCDCGCH